MTDNGSEPVIEMRNIVKVYPDGTLVLRGVDLTVKKGEIHGLLGENGAGKTTLMRILYGEIKPSKGEVRIYGKKVHFRGPWDAIKAGIGMVYQHFSLVSSFTVLENLALAMSSISKMSIDEVRRYAEDLMDKVGLKVPLDARVESLAVGLQQRVEILKALMRNAKILILDEPTSVLTPIEVDELFKTLKKLKEMGITIIFITHKLKEVKAITDTITVLRRGEVVGVVKTSEASEAELARMMVGREVLLEIKKKPAKEGSVVLRIEDLHVRDDRGLLAVKGVTLELREGEILGLAGVQGNGQRELAEAIVGLRPIEKRRIIYMGEDITNKPTSEIYMKGIAYIPDSRAIGLVLEIDILNNSILTRLKSFLGLGKRILWSKAREYSNKVIKEFNVITESIRTPVKYLSGGNQQKVLVGREIATKPKVIIAAEPTHGLDVGATEYIRTLLVKLRDRGKAILLISTDLDEITQLSDRIAVIYEGKIMAVGKTEEFTREKLGLLMGGISA
ncbi:MAG: ABC transporter ATP-binding protein [Aigarchaeota archaeon]|nr:ABC transporter ATP-binding protein [Candidatus Pelearchaeum maunauluense]